MRPGMRHPPPGPPLRPPLRLMPAPSDGGVFFGARDFARRQQQQQQLPPPQNYPTQKPLLPPGTPPQQWQNNPNFRGGGGGPMPLLRPTGPWHPHANTYHSTSPPPPPPPPPLLHPHHSHHPSFNPNSQTPITYVPPNVNNYELMRLATQDQIPFFEGHEEDEQLVRQHLSSNNSNNNDESLGVSNASPSKTNKRRRQQQQQQQQQDNNRNVVSYQDLDRPEEHNTTFVKRVPKSNKSNQLPTDKTNNHYPTKASVDNDQALKLELDRIKKAGAQEREKLKAQRQAAAEKEALLKKNSVKTGDKEKREDGELGDSSDDENTKSTPPQEQKRLKKIVDNLALQSIKSTGTSSRSKTPPSENILDMNMMKLIRPMKLFHLDDEKNSAYREYLTTNFGRVRVHCHKPQPNFFSNLSCIEEIKRRLRLNGNLSTSSNLLRNLLDDNEDPLLNVPLTTEPEDGEIESDEENIPMDINGKMIHKMKNLHQLSDDDNEKPLKKKSKLNDDGTTNDLIKSSLNEKPWITPELRLLIKQRNKLQAQILSGETNPEIEKKFKKIRNKISKHAKTLKAKYENSLSGSNEPSLAPPISSQSSSIHASNAATAAANHPLSTILDPSLVMAMLVNPTLYSQVQQQVLSNPSFMQAYQHMFTEGAGAVLSKTNQPPKTASETQVVPSTATFDDFLKQAVIPKSGKDSIQSQNVSSTRSRPVLTQATKPIQLTSLESEIELEQRKGKSRFTPAETSLTDAQAQEIAATQELIRRQLALTQQQQRNQRNSNVPGQLSLSSPLNRHIPLTTEQMQEIVARAKNYVTRQQTDETNDTNNNPPRLSYNTRRLQAALAASASSATPQTAHTINQAAAAAIAAVASRPSSSTTATTSTIASTAPLLASPLVSTGATATMPTPAAAMTRPIPTANPINTSSMPPGAPPPQQHPIRIQLDQKSKTLSTISNNQSLPIPTINQQKIMPLIDMNHSPPSHMYANPPNWQRPPPPPHLAGQPHYPMGPPQQQQGPPPPQHYPPYDNPHGPPYYGPRVNYPPDMRPMGPYGAMPPRHLSQPQRYNGPVPPPPGPPYGYGGHPPQNYGPPPTQAPPPHPHYGHPYPPS